jgi:MFS family permease
MFHENLASTARSTPHAQSSRGYLMVALSTVGTSLEYYDFVIFVFFINTLRTIFFPSGMPEWLAQVEAFGIFATGYVARPLGGIILAHYADMLGRKRMFVLTVLLMSLSSFGMALLPTYAAIGAGAPLLLLVLRVMQGAAIGAEMPSAWTFVAEHVDPKRIGLACGLIAGGVAFGTLLGSFTAAAVNAFLAPDAIASFGWRLPFFFGGFAGLFSAYMRRYLSETPVFEGLQKEQALAHEFPLRIVLREHRTAVAVAIALSWFLVATYVVFALMTPTLLQTVYGFPPQIALRASTYSTTGVLCGAIAGGALIDAIGIRRFLMLGIIFLLFGQYMLYTQIFHSPDRLLPLCALAGVLTGVVVAVPYAMVHSFPSAVRATGISFSFNSAWAVFGGLTPIVITAGLYFDPLAHLHYLIVVSAVGLLAGVFWKASPEPTQDGLI